MGMDFLSQIVTGYELWVHQFKPGIKQQSIAAYYMTIREEVQNSSVSRITDGVCLLVY
jgi:hypothetical protein